MMYFKPVRGKNLAGFFMRNSKEEKMRISKPVWTGSFEGDIPEAIHEFDVMGSQHGIIHMTVGAVKVVVLGTGRNRMEIPRGYLRKEKEGLSLEDAMFAVASEVEDNFHEICADANIAQEIMGVLKGLVAMETYSLAAASSMN